MNMQRWLLALAARFLFFALLFFALLEASGGRMDPGLLYLILAVLSGACSCFFAGLAFLRKAYISPSPTAQMLWGVTGCAALLPAAYVLGICLNIV